MNAYSTNAGHKTGSAMTSRISFIFALILFKFVLDACYFYYVSPTFNNHFIARLVINFESSRYLYSFGFIILAGLFSPFKKNSFNGIAFLIFLLFLYLPMVSMAGLDSELPLFPIWLALIALFVIFIFSTASFVSFKLPMVSNGEVITLFVSLCFSLIFLAWSVISGAINNFNLDLTQMYYYREVNTILLDVGGMGYVNLWTQKVFNPMLIIIGLRRKNYLIFGFAMVVQIYFFGVTQHRAHLFIPVLIFAMYYLYASKISLVKLYVYFSLALSVFLILALRYQWDDMIAIIIRRAFFVPASATFGWVDYFSANPKVYFADKILSRPSIYEGQGLPRVLGDYLVPGKKLNYNTGLVGVGFAQLGVWGVILYAVILGVVLKFVNMLIENGAPLYIVAAILISPVRSAWADSDIFTAILSHGIFVGIIMLWLYGSPKTFRNTAY